MDWNSIKTEYITTSISYRKLADKHGVPFKTLAYRAGNEKWPKLRQRHSDNIVTKSVKEAEKGAKEYKSTLYALAYKVAMQLDSLTEGRTMEELVAVGIKPRDITGAIKDLEDVLHIKSETDIAEQQARIAKLQKEAEGESSEDKAVKVIIADGAEKYSG